MKLYTGPVSMFGAKVLIAAAEKGITLDVENVPYELATATYPGHPEVDRINPKRQVPVLIDQDLELFDSSLIFEYFEDLYPEPPLWPGEPRRRAAARLMELKADEVWFPKLRRLGYVAGQPQSAEAAEAKAEAIDAYREIDATLGGRTWMAGAFSYADIGVYTAVLTGFFLGGPAPAELERLHAWRRRMDERSSAKRVRQDLLAYIASQRAAQAEPA